MKNKHLFICMVMGTVTIVLCSSFFTPTHTLDVDQSFFSQRGQERIQSIMQSLHCSSRGYSNAFAVVDEYVPAVGALDVFMLANGERHVVVETKKPATLCVQPNGLVSSVLFADGALCDQSLLTPTLCASLPQVTTPASFATLSPKSDRLLFAAWVSNSSVDDHMCSWIDKTCITLTPKNNQYQLWCTHTTSMQLLHEAIELMRSRVDDVQTNKKRQQVKPVVDLRIPHTIIVKNKPKGWVVV